MGTRHAMPLFTATHREIRRYVKVGRQWRLDTWETLYTALSEVGVGFSGAAPGSAIYYTAIAEIAAEYLGEKPNQTRFRLLHRRLAFDLDQAGKTLKHMDCFRSGSARLSSNRRLHALCEKLIVCAFDDDEVALMREAIHRCVLLRDKISQCCPGTS